MEEKILKSKLKSCFWSKAVFKKIKKKGEERKKIYLYTKRRIFCFKFNFESCFSHSVGKLGNMLFVDTKFQLHLPTYR